MVGTIVLYVIVGLIVGALARLTLPGSDPIGMVGTILLGVVGGLVIVSSHGHPPAPRSGALFIHGTPVLPNALGSHSGHVGKRVTGQAIEVQSVPTDEGFWVGPDEAHRVFVELKTSGESSVAVRAGQTVSFTGRVVSHGRRLVERLDLGVQEGRATLLDQEQHILVVESKLRIK